MVARARRWKKNLTVKARVKFWGEVELFYAFIWGSGYMTVCICQDLLYSTLKRIHLTVCKVCIHLIFKRSRIINI